MNDTFLSSTSKIHEITTQKLIKNGRKIHLSDKRKSKSERPDPSIQ